MLHMLAYLAVEINIRIYKGVYVMTVFYFYILK